MTTDIQIFSLKLSPFKDSHNSGQALVGSEFFWVWRKYFLKIEKDESCRWANVDISVIDLCRANCNRHYGELRDNATDRKADSINLAISKKNNSYFLKDWHLHIIKEAKRQNETDIFDVKSVETFIFMTWDCSDFGWYGLKKMIKIETFWPKSTQGVGGGCRGDRVQAAARVRMLKITKREAKKISI